ncbi:MAG: tyrosine-type recombinase/integrase, partial [Melioribacteraceae bacterium]
MYVVKIPRSKFYQVVYFIDGKRTTISTKTSKYNEAILFLERLKNPEASIQEIQPIKNSGIQEITLSAFKDEYLDYTRPLKSRRYIISIESSFRQLVQIIGNCTIQEINTRILDKFITTTYSRTQRGAHHYYRTLKAAFNKAVEWEYISINPFIKIKFPRLPKAFPIFISEDEMQIILANTHQQYLKDIFTVGFYTGLRLGELINMRCTWVDYFQNQITVKCSDQFLTKNKKERIVPMNEKVRAILLSRLNSNSHQQHEVVFYKTKDKILYQ